MPPLFPSAPLPRAGNGTRTRDPNLGKVVLYQLSYSRNAPLPLCPSARLHGGEGDRTPDLVNAIHALSQLSYAPAIFSIACREDRRGGKLAAVPGHVKRNPYHSPAPLRKATAPHDSRRAYSDRSTPAVACRRAGVSKRRAEREVSAGGIVFRRGAVPTEGPSFLLIKDSYGNWGFPKGHLEDGEDPATAALRETGEEAGLGNLILHGPIRVIDWYFRFRGRLIHKYCHFFLFESPEGEPTPQGDEGITACGWFPFDQAMAGLSYENARGVLRRANDMARTLVASGAGRSRPASKTS